MFQRICSWSLTSVCAYILGTGCEIQKKHAVLLATLLPLFFYNMLSQHVRCPKLCNLRRKKTIWPDFKLLISLKLELDRGSSPMVRHNWISLEPACMLWPGKQIKQISTIHVWSCELHGPFQSCKQCIQSMKSSLKPCRSVEQYCKENKTVGSSTRWLFLGSYLPMIALRPKTAGKHQLSARHKKPSTQR